MSKKQRQSIDNGIKTMTLDSIGKLQEKKKRSDIDSLFDFLSKTVATIIDKDTLTDSISQLITLKLLVNKKTPNGYDSLYLSNIDQREIEPTSETKSSSVQTLTLNTPKETPQFPISYKFLNPQHQNTKTSKH